MLQRILKNPAALLGGIVAATLLVYVRTASFAFVYDDVWEIVDNLEIRSWARVGHYFTATYARTPYYRPLFVLWFRINDALFGLNPAGWHVLSILMHVAVTVLVYWFVRRLADSRVALIAAALFGVHPIHIESVAWVSGVCDPISAVFFLAAFMAYLEASRSQSVAKWTLVACLAYALALLTKEPNIVFPAVVAVHAYLFSAEQPSKWMTAVRRAAPFAAIAVSYVLFRQWMLPVTLNAGQHVSLATAVCTVPSVLWFYIAKLFWPVDLNVFYDLPYVNAPTMAQFVVPLLLLGAIAAGMWFWARRSPHSKLIQFGAAWFLITLAPALYVRLLAPGEIAHDRYLYLPSIGFCLLAGLLLASRSEPRNVAERKSPAQLPAAVALGLCIALAGLNVAQQGYWASDAALYSHGFASAPANNNVANNYARLLTDRGFYRQAIPIFEAVLARDPANGTAHYNLGYTYYRLGEWDKARQHLERAVQIDPLDGFAYVHIGLVELREKNLNAAESAIRHGIALAPARPGCHLALSFVLEGKGDTAGALAEMREELRYSPDNQVLQSRTRSLEQVLK